MNVTIQQQINELNSIKSSLYTAINTACIAHNKPTIPVAEQGDFSYYATHIYVNLCGDTPTPTTYTITATSANPELGTVSGGGTYGEGEIVTLTATPNAGRLFIDWTKDEVEVSTSATYTFTASSSTAGEYIAHFYGTVPPPTTYTILVECNPQQGTVSGGGTYGEGETVTLTATPNSGYIFANWTKDGVEVSTSATYTFTASSSTAGGYMANFDARRMCAISVSSNEPTMGTVSVNPMLVEYGGSATLNAVVSDSELYKFLGWREESATTYISTDATYTLSNITSDASYTGEFGRKGSFFTVNAVIQSGEGAVTYSVDSGQSQLVMLGTEYQVPEGSRITLTATPNDTSDFVGWGGYITSTNPSIEFNAEEDTSKSFTVQFDRKERITI